MPRLLTSTCIGLLMAATLGAQALQVQWAKEQLSVRADGVLLRDLVQTVATRAAVTVTGADRLTGRVSIDFRDKPLVEGLSLLLEGVNHIVTRRGGVLHVDVHSMSGAAPSPRAATGPIFIRGLSDRVPNETPPNPGPPDAVEPDEEEKEELAELERLAVDIDERAINALITALDSDYPSVRMRAVRAFAGRDPALAAEHLGDRLTDEEPHIAMTAADMLAAMPGTAALEALATNLGGDVDPDVQALALRGLARRADPASIPYIRRALDDIDPELRDAASQLLRELEERLRASRTADRER